ncbi:MAG: hypothetical protein J6M24_05200 [Lachnospiraceae bacterium]|nr:hypothetical protein [Lachnospiraceae bacterium]
MNKTVRVEGMEVKAHAEEGLLINEVAKADSDYWDELAFAGDTEYVQLRPASTKDLTTWWHANSKKSANDAGLSASGTVDTDTVELSSGTYYSNISFANVEKKLTNGSGSEGTAAERNVYFKDAAYGNTSGSYDNGEGFYVNYKYYIKSSSTSAMNVAAEKFQVKVEASKNAGSSGSSADLDKSLRVGVKIDSTYMIFAPLGGDDTYYVTGDVDGTGKTKLDKADTTGTRYTTSTDYVAFNTAALAIPSVTTDGKLVDVYIWFEGEDKNCKSDNLAEVLDDLDVNIYFKDATLE